MERRIMKIQCLVLCLFLFSCCLEKDKTHWYYADSYVFEYVQYDRIVLSTWSCCEIVVEVIPTNSYGAFSRSQIGLEKYRAKCQLYNDHGYDLSFWTLDSYSYRNCVQDRDFEAIRIYSNKDYSANYPSGTNLASLYYIASRSPYRYIESGYKLTYDAESVDYPAYYLDYLSKKRGIHFAIGDGVFPVFGVLSDLTSKDMKLLGFGDYWTSPFEILTLYPTCLPDDKSVHTITVEMLDTEGNTLTSCVDVDFSKLSFEPS